ncbi:PulJ/GspJ family protein [Falsibacillus pallidus]|uniref:PulJ/GspJ family protein n=1 Tax=Falsibacillus pallidus TaxID=493781 RepID=UPI003D99E1A6
MEIITKKIRTENGFTLVEMLAAMTIFLLVIGVVTGFLLQSNHFISQRSSMSIQEGNDEAARMLLQQTFSSGVEIYYSAGQEIRVRLKEGTCHSFNVNATQQIMYHYEDVCTDLSSFSFTAQGEAFSGIKQIKLLDAKTGKEVPNSTFSNSNKALTIQLSGEKTIQYSFNLLLKEQQ